MNAERSMELVRELSENATRRPAAKHLRLNQPAASGKGPKRAIIALEDSMPIRFGGDDNCRASGRSSRKREGAEPAPAKRNFLQLAMEKTAA